ncbi:hypothetical protein [Sulfitobacter geojensis]|uniref:hypothetical protein n=1 Tax=Sulfitobacter geojensis TaxID=1342299 RepID=UPI0007D9663E|nr:hypothetical protein [Sulfitobacter geojensis]OAN95734.1 hypothetical protein A8B74_15465 [Sulfitobacter geojensis]
MQINKQIGYARIDSAAHKAVLSEWVNRLLEIGVREVVIDIGPLPDGLDGLQAAVGCLRINDALIYPEACLEKLTVADIPIMFGHIPEGTALTFFEPLVAGHQQGEDFTSIRLIDADGENTGG